MKAGIGVLASAVLYANATAAQTQYAVDGVGLATQLSLNSAAYREYRCSPSEQFDGLTWCQKTRNDKERRGAYSAAYSVLHSRDGSVLYVNRSQEPAFVRANQFQEEIGRYTKKLGQTPRIINMPERGGAKGVIAVWGDARLEPLDQESTRIIASGGSPKKGLLIDFVGNFVRSAKEGLAIYRIDGGAGFVWAASFDQKGRGTLRFAAVDASRLLPAPATAEQPPLQGSVASAEPEATPAETESSIEQMQAELAGARRTIAELEQAKLDAEEARIEADQARAAAEIARSDMEQTRAAEKARLDAAIAALKGKRWEYTLYGSAGGLLIALAASAIGFVGRRRKASVLQQQVSELASSPAEASPQSPTSETENVPDAPSPPIAISETVFENELEAEVAAINAGEEEATLAEGEISLVARKPGDNEDCRDGPAAGSDQCTLPVPVKSEALREEAQKAQG